jgi:hypothetical protein
VRACAARDEKAHAYKNSVDRFVTRLWHIFHYAALLRAGEALSAQNMTESGTRSGSLT